MYREQGRPAAKLDREIAVTHSIHRVLRQFGPAALIDKTQQTSSQGAVQRQGRTRQRAAAQRTNGDAVAALLKPLKVALEHFDVCQKVMRQQHGLGPLKMRVAGK